ncbi:MAG: hypothetical protein K2K41_07830, partial [Ruminiclostridium sp.]|nr:hypothetical protein [Ruminiclostridium sp.]
MKKINKISSVSLLTAFALVITGCSKAGNTDADLTQAENTIKTEQGQNTSDPHTETGGNAENGTDPENSHTSEAQTADDPPIENEQVINGNMVYSYKGHWYGIQLYAGGYN